MKFVISNTNEESPSPSKQATTTPTPDGTTDKITHTKMAWGSKLSDLPPDCKTRAKKASKIFRASIAVEIGFPTNDEKNEMIFAAFHDAATPGSAQSDDEQLKRWKTDEKYQTQIAHIVCPLSLLVLRILNVIRLVEMQLLQDSN